jgi:hypothetical protein
VKSIYSWQLAYFAAVCETDDSLLMGRILEARSAIEQRLLSPIDMEGEEYKGIKNAERGLAILTGERFPKSNGTISNFIAGPFEPRSLSI